MASQVVAWIFSAVCAGAGAFFGAYLAKRGELQAITETLVKHTRIAETGRLRWTKRWEVIPELRGLLKEYHNEFAELLAGPYPPSTRFEALNANRLTSEGKLLQNGVFLPKRIENTLQELSDMIWGYHVKLLNSWSPNDTSNNRPDADKLTDQWTCDFAVAGSALQPTGTIGQKLEELDHSLREYLDE